MAKNSASQTSPPPEPRHGAQMKKTEQIAWHTDPDTRAQVVALANLEGKSVSEWAESLIDRELGEQLRHYEALQAVFAMATERKEP